MSLTAARLREVFHYDPETGLFTRLIDKSNRGRVGTIATCRNRWGYVVFRIDGALYRANRCAVLYMTGEWPRGTVDHRDTDPANDRWVNLRDVPCQVNCQNARRARASSQSGLLGASPTPKGRWVAGISMDGRKEHLGTFETPEAAHLAYVERKRVLHAGCTL